MSQVDYDDAALLKELAFLCARNDPMPDTVASQARASFRFASPWDSALAALVYDSATDDRDVRALVRASSSARELTFESPGLTVEIEVGWTEQVRRGRCRILGQLVPAQSADIEIRHPEGSLHIHSDDLGRFAIEDAPTGPVSLRCTPVDGEPTDTEWTVI
jgi:hypothetical protein